MCQFSNIYLYSVQNKLKIIKILMFVAYFNLILISVTVKNNNTYEFNSQTISVIKKIFYQ